MKYVFILKRIDANRELNCLEIKTNLRRRYTELQVKTLELTNDSNDAEKTENLKKSSPDVSEN